jgi:MFS family permease
MRQLSSAHCEPPIRWRGLGLVFLTPALGGFLYGYDIGATSFVFRDLVVQPNSYDDAFLTPAYTRDDDLTNDPRVIWWYNLKDRRIVQGLIVGAISLGALFGSHLVLFHLANQISRRMELRIAALLYVVGSACNILSGTVWCYAYTFGCALLVIGRLMFGAGVGFFMRELLE